MFQKIGTAAWITQFVLTLIGFNWVAYLAHEFGSYSWFTSIIVLIAFAALAHLYIPLAAVFSYICIRIFKIESDFKRLMIFALTLAFAERIWPSVFEWNLGYSLLWSKNPIFQWVDTIGVWGISTLILIVQAMLGYAWLNRADKKIVTTTTGVVASLLAIFMYFGIIKQEKWKTTDREITVNLVQPNVSNAQKLESELKENFQSHILELFVNLTEESFKTSPAPADFVIWPETALPFPLDPYFKRRTLQQVLYSRVNKWDVTLITGGYSQSYEQQNSLGEMVSRNSAFVIDAKNPDETKIYNKTKLLAFSEYLPFGKYFTGLYKYFPYASEYEIGSGPTVQIVNYKNGQVKLGPQICYESLDAEFSRQLAVNGAEVLYNLTNDAWFGWWAEPYQHNTMAQARAIEVRRPLIRATNSGVSSVILANGDVLQESTTRTQWTGQFKVKYQSQPEQSFYTKYGHYDWILWLLVLLHLLLFKNLSKLFYKFRA